MPIDIVSLLPPNTVLPCLRVMSGYCTVLTHHKKEKHTPGSIREERGHKAVQNSWTCRIAEGRVRGWRIQMGRAALGLKDCFIISSQPVFKDILVLSKI